MKQKTLQTVSKYRKSGDKYKTHPGLSISNHELKERVKNRSIRINQDGKVYNTDLAVGQILKSSPADLHRQWLQNQRTITTLHDAAQQVLAEMKKAIKVNPTKDGNENG